MYSAKYIIQPAVFLIISILYDIIRGKPLGGDTDFIDMDPD